MRLLIIPVFAAVLLVMFYSGSFTGFFPGPGSARVTRVIDGDTVELENGEKVRLLGIDTPEKGQYLFSESTEWLRDIVEGKVVRLEMGLENRDKYGRLLRYIHLDDRFVNLELVRLGYANAYMLEEDDPHYEIITRTESSVRDAELGIWSMDIPDAFCMGIFYFHSNAAGDDNDNLNDEYVTLRNKCEYPMSVNRWALGDSTGHVYVFPDITVPGKATVTLHTGSGQDNETDLYWGMSRAVWNNDGDTLSMWNYDGDVILDYEYQF